MTLGLIIIEDIDSLNEAITTLEMHKEKLLKTCANYFIYTAYNKPEFLSKLSSIKDLYKITYDIVDDLYLDKEALQEFHTLIYLNRKGIQYSY